MSLPCVAHRRPAGGPPAQCRHMPRPRDAQQNLSMSSVSMDFSACNNLSQCPISNQVLPRVVEQMERIAMCNSLLELEVNVQDILEKFDVQHIQSFVACRLNVPSFADFVKVCCTSIQRPKFSLTFVEVLLHIYSMLRVLLDVGFGFQVSVRHALGIDDLQRTRPST